LLDALPAELRDIVGKFNLGGGDDTIAAVEDIAANRGKLRRASRSQLRRPIRTIARSDFCASASTLPTATSAHSHGNRRVAIAGAGRAQALRSSPVVYLDRLGALAARFCRGARHLA